MKILGIDPALTVSGYGVIDAKNKEIFVLEAGIIKTCVKDSLPIRLNSIYQGIINLISETKPDVVVLEKLYVHSHHPMTAYILGQARGVICLACAVKNIALIEYSATRIKKAIVGEGHASKCQMQRMVADILNLKTLPKYNDVTDALALAIAHSNIMRAVI